MTDNSSDNSALETGHVGLNVSDLDRSVDFYTAALGLSVLKRSDEAERRFAFLTKGNKLVLTLWEQSTGTFDPSSPGLHHLSFQVPDVDAVRQAEERLKALGASFAHEGVVAHAEGASSGGIYFTDPDGTRLEIYAPAGVEGAPAPTADAPTCGFF
jgi:catechol 2,3-dioxygenase-like lactoylglutathione lyase family enzyme